MTGRSRAVPAAATAWPRGSRRRLPGRNRRNGTRFLPGRPSGSCKSTGRFLPDGRAGTASVGRFLRRSRAATAAPLLGAAPRLCGRFLDVLSNPGCVMCGKARKLKTSIECDLAEYCEALNLLRQRVHLGPIWTEFRYLPPLFDRENFRRWRPPRGGAGCT